MLNNTSQRQPDSVRSDANRWGRQPTTSLPSFLCVKSEHEQRSKLEPRQASPAGHGSRFPTSDNARRWHNCGLWWSLTARPLGCWAA